MSTILVNTLTGTSTAGSIAVTGEGNSTTTNLQQGLCKAWVNFNGTGTIATRDSFNVSGLTDNGTSDYTTSFSSSMSNDDYAVPAQSTANGYAYFINAPKNAADASITTSAIRSYGADYNGNVDDHHFVHISIFGDLA